MARKSCALATAVLLCGSLPLLAADKPKFAAAPAVLYSEVQPARIPGGQFIQDDLYCGSRSGHSDQNLYPRLRSAEFKKIATLEAIFTYDPAMRDQMLPPKELPYQLEQEEVRASFLARAASGEALRFHNTPEEQIRSLLQEMDAAANAHDTDRFMAPFLHNDRLVFVINGTVVFLAPGMPRLKEWAYAGFSITILSACYSHLCSGDGLLALEPLLTFAALVGSYFARPDDRKLPDSIPLL